MTTQEILDAWTERVASAENDLASARRELSEVYCELHDQTHQALAEQLRFACVKLADAQEHARRVRSALVGLADALGQRRAQG